jgi:tetratricopeptide (TPR) repeat protein
MQRKQPEKALPELRLALKSSPGNAGLLEQIGDLEDQLGNRDAALAAWQQAASNATDSSMRKRLVKRIARR